MLERVGIEAIRTEGNRQVAVGFQGPIGSRLYGMSPECHRMAPGRCLIPA